MQNDPKERLERGFSPGGTNHKSNCTKIMNGEEHVQNINGDASHEELHKFTWTYC